MRHRDDDLEPFREDPVVQALTGPGSPEELAGEADAVAAYRGAAPVPPQRRRSAARVATGTTVAVLVLGVSGGVAAAYGNYLPDSWQNKLHKEVSSIPAADTKPPKPPVALNTPPPATPAQSLPPSPSPAASGKTTPKASTKPSTTASTAPSASATLPVTVPTATASTTPSPTVSASATAPPPPAVGGQLQIRVSPGTNVAVGTSLTVAGKLTDAGGDAVADRRVVLVERVPGEAGRHRLGSARTSADGEVTIAGPSVQRNVKLVLRAGHLRSPVQRIVVIPVIHVEVPATAPGATSVTVSVSVTGAQAGDVVLVRGPGSRDSRRATLDSSLHAVFTLPVSQRRALHYQAFVPATRAHGAHSLPFYVPASGG